MKKIFTALTILAVLAVSGLALDRKVLTCTTNPTNAIAPVTDSIATIRGYIEEIVIDVVTAGTTGDISIVATSDISTVAPVILAVTNNCGADVIIYSSGEYPICGETITMTVTNASRTNVQFRAIIKYEK